MTLPNGRRADILALRPDGGFVCIEVKSGPRDFLVDAKWPDYRDYADALFFAVDADFPQDLLPAEVGLIVAAGLEAELLRDAPAASVVRRRGGGRCCSASPRWRQAGSPRSRIRPGSRRCARRCGRSEGWSGWDGGYPPFDATRNSPPAPAGGPPDSKKGSVGLKVSLSISATNGSWQLVSGFAACGRASP